MKSAKSKLSIDIGAKNIKIAEIEDRHGYPYVTKHAVLDTPNGVLEEGIIKFPGKICDLFEHAIKFKGFYSKRAVLSISNAHILSREVVLPKVNIKDLNQLVDMEAPNHFPVDMSTYSVDFKVLGEVLENDVPQYKVLIIAAPLSLLEGYTDLFDLCGLSLEKIDYKGNSITKLLKHHEESKLFEDSMTNAVLDIGYENSNVTICKDGVIKYSRSLPFGSKQYNKELKEILGCTDEEAEKIKIETGVVIADAEEELDTIQQAAKQAWVKSSVPLFDEVTRVIDFFTSRQNTNTIDRILLTGGGSLIPNIVSYMHNSFDMQIDFLTCDGAVEFYDPKPDMVYFSAYFANCVGAVYNE